VKEVSENDNEVSMDKKKKIDQAQKDPRVAVLWGAL